MIQCLKDSYGEFRDTEYLGLFAWAHFDLILVHHGKMLIRLMGTEQARLNSGQGILIYPETPFEPTAVSQNSTVSVHHFELDSDCEGLPSVLKDLAGRKEGFATFLQHSVHALKHDIKRVTELAHERPSQLIQDMRSALITLIIAQLRIACVEGYDSSCKETQFRSLITWLGHNLDRSITIADMAIRAGLSTSHFSARFKSQLGSSPGHYYWMMCLNEGARLLRETSIPIKRIASRQGYSELSHFYRAFKSLYNITPKEYRIYNHNCQRSKRVF